MINEFPRRLNGTVITVTFETMNMMGSLTRNREKKDDGCDIIPVNLMNDVSFPLLLLVLFPCHTCILVACNVISAVGAER
jgi:hypothetical protein